MSPKLKDPRNFYTLHSLQEKYVFTSIGFAKAQSDLADIFVTKNKIIAKTISFCNQYWLPLQKEWAFATTAIAVAKPMNLCNQNDCRPKNYKTMWPKFCDDSHVRRKTYKLLIAKTMNSLQLGSNVVTNYLSFCNH